MIEEYQWTTDDIVVHAVLTESHIPEDWQGTMNEVNFVCRDMIPDHNGTPLPRGASADPCRGISLRHANHSLCPISS